MNPSEITAESRLNERNFRLISSLLTAAMLACVAATVVSLVARLSPNWQPWYLVAFCFLVALDTLYSHEKFKEFDLLSAEWFRAAGAQVVIALVALWGLTGLSRGAGVFWEELTSGWYAFLASFISAEYLVGLGLCLMTWLLSLSFASLFDEMGLKAELIRMADDAIKPLESRPPRERLMSLTFNLGAALVVFVALLRIDFRALQSSVWENALLNVPALSNGGGSALLYFLLALALLSQTQFVNLHNRWSIQRVPVSASVVGRWAFYSVTFLLLLAALSSLLPTSYSLGLLASLGYALNLAAYLVFRLAQLLLMLFLLLLNLPALLFGLKAPSEAVEASEPPPLPEFPTLTPGLEAAAPLPWLEALKSLLFWGVFLGALLFTAVQYLRQHEEAISALRQRPGLAWLGRLWAWLRGAWQAVREDVTQAVASGLERLRARHALASLGGGWINLRRLDPRQRVFFFYQAFLRRSGESGLPRSRSQTPSEFAAGLESALPEAQPDIEALTGAFIEARYAPRVIEPARASAARAVWQRLRAALRRRSPD